MLTSPKRTALHALAGATDLVSSHAPFVGSAQGANVNAIDNEERTPL